MNSWDKNLTDQPRCRDCVWCVLEDHGYSNYTVEGTRQGCLRKLNPKFPLEDSFYGDEPGNEFAQQCPQFEAGLPIHLDVDCESPVADYAANDEVKAYLLLSVSPSHPSQDPCFSILKHIYP